ncbi:MAG: CpaF family protein [Deltaproteobacteria bacterium]
MDKTLKNKIKNKIIVEYRGLLYDEHLNADKLKKTVLEVTNSIIAAEQQSLSEEDKKRLIEEVINDFLGLGEMELFLRDPAITEIMINGPKKVYIEKNGKKTLSGVTFEDDTHLMRIIYKILAPTRRRVDESSPFTDVSLEDGSRVNIIIPPLALDGPTMTVRKFSKELKTADDLVTLGTLDTRMKDFLVASIMAKMNIIFSGPTGAGKTTTLNVFSSYISNDQRIITIEDTAELRLSQEQVVRLEAKPANMEGKGEVTIRDLFKNSLRMRPDRIILGEIRGAEALDMLQAVCSGHKGSLVVIHGNSARDVIYRLETIILISGVPISLEVIQRQISSAIHLIVHQEQLPDGSRKIMSISQVSGLKEGQVVLEDIFVYDFEGLDSAGKAKGRWRATGVLPVFFPLFKKAGVNISEDLFVKG